VLMNNAGGVFSERVVTADGFEKSFQVNYLSSFLLTRLLLDKLIASRATVTMTSSSGARQVKRLDLDDLQNQRYYEPARAYCAAKLEDILFAKELHRRYHDQGLSAAAINPGIVMTNFGSETTNRIIRFVRFIGQSRIVRSVFRAVEPEQGADQLVWLASSRADVDWQSGGYYEKREPAKRINPQALDADLACGLWEHSEKLLA
jgi:NAD(P)-dependent dehydrogenase (short-subunit alcohol dehydrogenase family)